MSEQLPTISIVMPSLNQGEFIGAAIDSVITQDYSAIELIVVDGGSDDRSIDEIRSRESRIAWWCSESDGGQSAAINKGVRLATGSILGWLNSDDLLERGALSRVAAHLEPGAPAWSIGRTRLIDPLGESLGFRSGSSVTVDTFAEWGRYNFSQQAVFWTREMWTSVGELNPNLHYVMDLDLWWRMFNIATPGYIPHILGSYRLHGQAKCVADPNALDMEYRAWLVSVLTAGCGRGNGANSKALAERIVQRFHESVHHERELHHVCNHVVIGRLIGWWRKWINHRLPKPPAL